MNITVDGREIKTSPYWIIRDGIMSIGADSILILEKYLKPGDFIIKLSAEIVHYNLKEL